MKSFFTLNLNSATDQKTVMDLLQSSGAKVIQTSSGLFLSVDDPAKFLETLKSKNFSGVDALSEFKETSVTEDTPKDVLAFMKS